MPVFVLQSDVLNGPVLDIAKMLCDPEVLGQTITLPDACPYCIFALSGNLCSAHVNLTAAALKAASRPSLQAAEVNISCHYMSNMQVFENRGHVTIIFHLSRRWIAEMSLKRSNHKTRSHQCDAEYRILVRDCE